ncbi:IS21 family transposase [Zoogloea sp. LCSB751]|uniref:IS21 family transposase n=1 Tax=Zoogloea sp. LCSB751 TaxID=1965277 RepID=UPI0020B16FAD|nr:IS21 family transposase [Zoogloea sp. LCSB751]
MHFYDPTQSNRAIARGLHLSPNTVGTLRGKIVESGLTWNELRDLDDDQWTSALDTKNHSIAQRKLAPDWEWVDQQMQAEDATLNQVWLEWRAQSPDGIGFTQFCTQYKTWKRAQHIVMRQVHEPGNSLFVDFAGRTVEIRDPNGGPSSYAQIFVAALGYSSLTYIQAVFSQRIEDWIQCHIDCFAYLGGVPEWVVPDNLKAAVLRRMRDEIIINPAYRSCLDYYSTAPRPTGVRKPKHKSKAEVAVKIIQRGIIFRLRNHVFFSLEELNAELWKGMEALNRHPFKNMPGSRMERFTEVEKNKLKPLPDFPYELCNWRYRVRVGDDYHVAHGRSHYSVPHTLRGEYVDLRYTSTMLEVMHRNRRVALHELLKEPGGVSTKDEHRPIAHIRVLEGEPKALLTWAVSVGGKTEEMIRYHLESRKDMTNGLKAARRIRSLAHLHGDSRIQEVCAYALALNLTALRSIESIIKQSADKQELVKENLTSSLPNHENVRGGDYFEVQS